MNEIAAIARRVAAAGQGTDKELVHVPRGTSRAMRVFGRTLNPLTRLDQFGFFSSVFGGLFGGGGGGSSATQDYLNQIGKITAPLTTEGTNLINQYESGNLNAGDQLALNQANAASKAYLRQYYGNAGLQDSSQLANQLGAVDINSAITRQQLLNSYLTLGTNLYSTALGPYSAAATNVFNAQQAQQQQELGFLGNIFGNLAGNSSFTSAVGNLFSGLFSSGGASSAGADFGYSGS